MKVRVVGRGDAMAIGWTNKRNGIGIQEKGGKEIKVSTR
jgi:hypothetical protein